jgi:hypothetical protein
MNAETITQEMFNAPASFTGEPVAQPVPIKEKKRYIYPPEKIREYNKRMYDKNKEKERYECPICFGVYTYYNKAHHTHTEIHLRAIKFLEEQKQKKMNPPTLDTQIKGKVVYLDMDHYCHECKDFFQEDEVHLCTGHPQAPSKISIGEEVKEDVLINGTLE